MSAPDQMKERLKDGDTDPVFCKQVLNHIEGLDVKFKAACMAADGYKSEFHNAIE